MVNNYAYWNDFWGTPSRRSNPYGTPGTNPPYSKGYHRGEDVANYGATADVPNLRVGEIIDSGFADAIGSWVCVLPDEAPDRRDIYCHMYEPSMKRSGRVEAGDILGRTADWGEKPGSGWSGPHLHYVISNLSDGGYNTNRPDYDPRPVISNALANAVVQPNQRVAGSYGAKARLDPSTGQPAVEEKYLSAGTVGTFDGWITGQDVDGITTWYRGAYSGLWFWAGGFTDTGTHDLTDLNTAPVKPNERVAVSGGSKARVDATTDKPPVESGYVAGGQVAAFDGWKYGQDVDGNNAWVHRADVDLWHWTGGFTDTGVHDLADMNDKPEPEPDATRVVGDGGANIRDLPWRSSPTLGSSTAGEVVTMNAWAHADDVDGNNVWYRRGDGDWSWSGGFTSQSTAGLTEVAAPPEPAPPSKYNPLGLPEYTPVYPRAVVGLSAPLGFENCQVGGSRAKRTEKGVPPNVVQTSGIITLLIIHWAWPKGDDTRYFSTCNDRGSCPTSYVTADAEAIEFIRPGAKPASTGAEWNWRSWAIEVEPITDVDDVNVPSVTDAQVDEMIEQMVFLREHTGGLLDGVPVDFHLDREHVLAHSDVGKVACPGKYLLAKIPSMIEEAQRRYDERHPDPEPTRPLDPAEYPSLWSLRGELARAFGDEGP